MKPKQSLLKLLLIVLLGIPSITQVDENDINTLTLETLHGYWQFVGEAPDDGEISIIEGDWVPDLDDPDWTNLDFGNYFNWLFDEHPEEVSRIDQTVQTWLEEKWMREGGRRENPNYYDFANEQIDAPNVGQPDENPALYLKAKTVRKPMMTSSLNPIFWASLYFSQIGDRLWEYSKEQETNLFALVTSQDRNWSVELPEKISMKSNTSPIWFLDLFSVNKKGIQRADYEGPNKGITAMSDGNTAIYLSLIEKFLHDLYSESQVQRLEHGFPFSEVSLFFGSVS
jgi:hypothetical protein